jgi:hypothetical protein
VFAGDSVNRPYLKTFERIGIGEGSLAFARNDVHYGLQIRDWTNPSD